MRRVQRPSPGFTLVEVLVILAILAILAGVLIPSIANQVTKSDVSRVAADLGNVRTGMEAFLVDIKRYPGDIDDLVEGITTTDDDVMGNDYPSGLIPKWTGPYLDVMLADGDSLGTGFGARILDNFAVDSVTNDERYLAVKVRGLTQSDFLRVDEVIDTDTSSTEGRFIWTAGDTATYLALPIN